MKLLMGQFRLKRERCPLVNNLAKFYALSFMQAALGAFV